MTSAAPKEAGISVAAASSIAYFACRVCGRVLAAKAWGGAECSRCRSVSMQFPAAEPERPSLPVERPVAQDRAAHEQLRQHAQRCLAIVRRHVGAGLLADLGGPAKPFPNLAEEAGFNVTVLDRILPRGLSPSIRFREGGIHNENLLAQLEGVFDVVTAWGVLEEHLEPRRAARVLSLLCRPGGKLFLSGPEVGTFLTNHSIGRPAASNSQGRVCAQSRLAMERVFETLGCRMLASGRLVSSPLQSAAGLALGLAETVGGLGVKALLPRAWQSLRDQRSQLYQGTTYFVFERR